MKLNRNVEETGEAKRKNVHEKQTATGAATDNKSDSPLNDEYTR